MLHDGSLLILILLSAFGLRGCGQCCQRFRSTCLTVNHNGKSLLPIITLVFVESYSTNKACVIK
jgi:hypothetical protein